MKITETETLTDQSRNCIFILMLRKFVNIYKLFIEKNCCISDNNFLSVMCANDKDMAPICKLRRQSCGENLGRSIRGLHLKDLL